MSHDIHNRFDADDSIILVLVLDEVEEEVEHIEGVGLEGVWWVGGQAVQDFEGAVTESLFGVCGYEDWWALEDIYE